MPVVKEEKVAIGLSVPNAASTVATKDDLKEIDELLWNSAIGPKDYCDSGEKYQLAIMDQYKLYVEMADRISNRRGLTNTFFLTLNSAVFVLIGVFWKDQPVASPMFLAFPLAIAVGQCVAWWWLVRSYRLLNGAKYEVVGALEKHLPASPFWNAEWTALGKGEDWRKYLPLTHLEQWIPVLFGVVYVVGFLAAAFG